MTGLFFLSGTGIYTYSSSLSDIDTGTESDNTEDIRAPVLSTPLRHLPNFAGA
jgi:hypothetical protein